MLSHAELCSRGVAAFISFLRADDDARDSGKAALNAFAACSVLRSASSGRDLNMSSARTPAVSILLLQACTILLKPGQSENPTNLTVLVDAAVCCRASLLACTGMLEHREQVRLVEHHSPLLPQRRTAHQMPSALEILSAGVRGCVGGDARGLMPDASGNCHRASRCGGRIASSIARHFLQIRAGGNTTHCIIVVVMRKLLLAHKEARSTEPARYRGRLVHQAVQKSLILRLLPTTTWELCTRHFAASHFYSVPFHPGYKAAVAEQAAPRIRAVITEALCGSLRVQRCPRALERVVTRAQTCRRESLK